MNSEICPHFLRGCNGCSHWDKTYAEELEIKKHILESLLKVSIKIKAPTHFDLRTRFDLTYENGKMGLYSKDHQLIDLPSCPILHPELEKAFQYLRNFSFPISKGSLRLRLAPDLKTWGLWLDFANVDIKNLLDEKTLLKRLSEKFIIEIGQKKKRFNPETFKLMDPVPEFWFQTLNQKLLCCISSFTQPSWETADLLTEQILKWMNQILPKSIIEYGCGIGQYSIPLLNNGYALSVAESDPYALEFFKLNSKGYVLNTKGDWDTALVNPPRSGLKDFVKQLQIPQIKNLIYVSCFPESLAKDLEVLSKDFRIKDAVIVDQFPRSKHFESAVLLQRV